MRTIIRYMYIYNNENKNLRSFRLSYRSSSSSSSRSPSSSLAIPWVCTTLGISVDVRRKGKKNNINAVTCLVSPFREWREQKWGCDLTVANFSLLIGGIDFSRAWLIYLFRGGRWIECGSLHEGWVRGWMWIGGMYIGFFFYCWVWGFTIRCDC